VIKNRMVEVRRAMIAMRRAKEGRLVVSEAKKVAGWVAGVVNSPSTFVGVVRTGEAHL
jgi:hypothetical protein